MEFNPVRHTYHVIEGGERFKVPSVTTILGATIDKSGPLMGWAVNQALAVVKGALPDGTVVSEMFLDEVCNQAKKAHRVAKEAAADIGKEAHGYLEAHFKGEEFVLPSEEDPARRAYDAALGWVQEHKVQTLEVERRLYSRRLRASGTLDQLAVVDGELAIIDWKTGKRLYKEHRFQTAAYIAFREEEGCERIRKRYLVRTGDPIEVHVFNRSDYQEDIRGFKHALGLYRCL